MVRMMKNSINSLITSENYTTPQSYYEIKPYYNQNEIKRKTHNF